MQGWYDLISLFDVGGEWVTSEPAGGYLFRLAVTYPSPFYGSVLVGQCSGDVTEGVADVIRIYQTAPCVLANFWQPESWETRHLCARVVSPYSARVGLKIQVWSNQMLINPAVVNVVPSTSSSTALTSVAASATSVTLLAANSSRKGFTIYNDSTANLTVRLAATASSTAVDFVINSKGYYESAFGYTGVVAGIWDAVNGSARVVEFS